jgi:protein TonB
METKKSPEVDLTKKSAYFFSIGLFISTTLAVMAFEWRQKDSFIVIKPNENYFFDPLIDIPPTSNVPPTPVPVRINPVFKEVKEITKEVSIVLDPEKINAIEKDHVIETPVEVEINEETFSFVEESASPKGGMAQFYKYVAEKIKYPAQARRMGIEGRVFVEFVINKDGSLSDVKAIKGIGAGCDEEAVRIIQSAPSWNPGKQRGKAVKQRYTLPIIFKLG